MLPKCLSNIPDELFRNAKYLQTVTVEDGGKILSIGDYAFAGTSSLTALPGDAFTLYVKTLGAYAFAESGLVSVVIPQNVKEIPEGCFKDSKYLTSVTFKSSVRKIGKYAFEGTDGKISIKAQEDSSAIEVFKNEVTVYEDGMDAREVKVTTKSGSTFQTIVNGYEIHAIEGLGEWKIYVNGGIASSVLLHDSEGNAYREAIVDDLRIILREEAGSARLRIELTKSAREDGKTLDLNVSYGLAKMSLGIRVTEIGERAFAKTALTSVNITDSVVEIGEEAFAENAALQTVIIGSSLEKMGAGAFRSTPLLTGVEVSKKNAYFRNDSDSVLYMKQAFVDENDNVYYKWQLKLYPAARVPLTDDASYVIPQDVYSIDAYAFDGCSLRHVIVSDSVTEIKKGAFNNTGNLESIFFDDDIVITEKGIFDKNVVLDVPMYGALADYVDENKDTLKAIFHTPKTCFDVKLRENYAEILGLKTCHDHSNVVIPAYINGREVTALRANALAEKGITSLTLSKYLRNIDDGAFFGNELSSIDLVGTKSETFSEEGGAYFKTVTVTNGTYTLISYYSVVLNEDWEETSSALQYAYLTDGETLLFFLTGEADSFTLPKGTKAIGYGAFYKSGISELILDEATDTIGDYAFADSSVSDIVGLENVVSLGAHAFRNDTAVTSLSFGESIAWIGGGAFAGASNLAEITFGEDYDNGYYRYESGILYEYLSDVSVKLHSVLQSYVAADAHYADTDGEGRYVLVTPSKIMPDKADYSVTQIGAYAFVGLTFEKSSVIVVPSEEITVFDEAFANANITEVHFEGNASGTNAFLSSTYVYYPDGSDLARALKTHEKAVKVTSKNDFEYDDNDGKAATFTVTRLKVSVDTFVIPMYVGKENVDGTYLVKYVTAVGNATTKASVFSGGMADHLVLLTNITTIAPGAFRNNTALQTATLGDGVTEIPEEAFRGCTNLGTVKMSAYVKKIGAYAFAANSSLKALPVEVSAGTSKVTMIGKGAFMGCAAIETIELWNVADDDGGQLYIGSEAFSGCNADSFSTLYIPKSVVYIGEGAFYSTTSYITYVLFENDVWANVDDDLWREAENIPSVEDEEEEPQGFDFDALIEGTAIFNLSPVVTEGEHIKIDVPMNANNVIIYFEAKDPDMNAWNLFTPYVAFTWDTVDGFCAIIGLTEDAEGYVKNKNIPESQKFTTDEETGKKRVNIDYYKNGTLYIPEYRLGNPVRVLGLKLGGDGLGTNDFVEKVSIPNTVRTINRNAFKGFSALTSVVFGAGSEIESIEYRAFYGTKITSLTINGKHDVTIGEEAFAETKLTSDSVDKVAEIGQKAFADISLSTFTAEFGSVETIRENAFKDSAMTALTVECGLKTVEQNAADGCTMLASVSLVLAAGETSSIDDKTSSIGASAFKYATALASLMIELQPGAHLTIGASAFSGAVALKTLTIALGNGAQVDEIGDYAFYQAGLNVTSETAYSIDRNVEKIGDYAFAESKISAIPSKVKEIGDYAFYKVATLSDVSVLEVNTVGKAAFADSSISSFAFGAALKSFAEDNAEGEGSLHNTPYLREIKSNSTSGDYYAVNDLLIKRKDASNVTASAVAIKFAELSTKGHVEKVGEDLVGQPFEDYAITRVAYAAFRGNKSFNAGEFKILKVIDDYAFYGCTALQYFGTEFFDEENEIGLKISGQPSKIGAYAFAGTSLIRVTIKTASSLEIGEKAFFGYYEDANGAYKYEAGEYSLISGAYSGTRYSRSATLVEVYIGDGLKSIAKDAFGKCSNLKLVTINSNDMTIAAGAFSGAIIFMPDTAVNKGDIETNLGSNNTLVWYTPVNCLSIDADGNFVGINKYCTLHAGESHGDVTLPIYYAFNKKIAGIVATGGMLPDGNNSHISKIIYPRMTGYASYSAPSGTGTAFEMKSL